MHCGSGHLPQALDALKVGELQMYFIEQLKPMFVGWKFYVRNRQFTRTSERLVWYVTVHCINHSQDFDAIGNVAVEFTSCKKRVAVFGAELGNIEGTGQRRFSVSSIVEARRSAGAFFHAFNEIGLPFLRRYSDYREVISTLQSGGPLARLISPVSSMHSQQISALEAYASGI